MNWMVGQFLLMLVLCTLDALRFKSTVPRRGAAWVFPLCVVAAMYFGYYAGTQHAWFH